MLSWGDLWPRCSCVDVTEGLQILEQRILVRSVAIAPAQRVHRTANCQLTPWQTSSPHLSPVQTMFSLCYNCEQLYQPTTTNTNLPPPWFVSLQCLEYASTFSYFLTCNLLYCYGTYGSYSPYYYRFKSVLFANSLYIFRLIQFV